MAISQGAQANKNGRVFERMMIPIFRDAGFEVINSREIPETERYVIRNAPFVTIYNSGGKTEFVIVNKKRKIRVEAKYQAAPGSVDEKYPYMLLNGIYQYPEKEIIFVVDGGGYKPGARDWLQRHIDNNWLNYKASGKKIMLMSIVEFANWFNHEFN